MGRFAEAVHSHRKNLYYSKQGANSIIRKNAREALRKDLENMLASLDDDFDADDEKAYEWVKENE